jgi:hypothetical protein
MLLVTTRRLSAFKFLKFPDELEEVWRFGIWRKRNSASALARSEKGIGPDPQK